MGSGTDQANRGTTKLVALQVEAGFDGVALNHGNPALGSPIGNMLLPGSATSMTPTTDWALSPGDNRRVSSLFAGKLLPKSSRSG
jgi:hypothetical protein